MQSGSVVIFITFLTGLSGLVFQVVWQKYFSLFLGGEALSSVLVLSIFLGGLSIGYSVFGRWAKGKSAGELLKMAGFAEIGIGLWAFFFPTLFDMAWNIMPSLPIEQPLRGLVDLLLTAVLLLPATILMGSTLPLLTQGLSTDEGELSPIHTRIYGFNTLGACIGSLLAGFFLIRLFGLPLTLMGLSTLNILGGFIILWQGAQRPSEVPIVVEASPVLGSAKAAPRFFYGTLVLAFASGFVSIGFETLFIRSLNLALGTSEYSYSVVVGVFICMIAAGSFSLGLSKHPWNRNLFINQIGLVIGLIAIYLTVPYWGWLNRVVRSSLTSLPSNFYFYQILIFFCFSVVIALPLFFMGRSMPLLFASLKSSMAGAAENVGRIYTANTLGCCVGGWVMGYLLLLNFNSDFVFRFGIVLAALSGMVLLQIPTLNAKSRWAYGVLVLALIVNSLILPKWDPAMIASGLYRERASMGIDYLRPSLFMKQVADVRKVLFFRDDPNTNVAVIEVSNTNSQSLVVNGKSDGSSTGPDVLTNLLLSHLPGLMTEAVGDAAMIGLGLGTSARVLAQYKNVNKVEVFELAQGVIDAQKYFANLNKGVTQNPKVQIHRSDAFRGLLASPSKYSMILSEPSNPWVSGVDRLYTLEFYEAAKQKMLPGGTFAQWIHTYEMSFDTFGIVMRTFGEAFPYLRIFHNGDDLILLGSLSPWTDQHWMRAEERWLEGGAGSDFKDFNIKSFSELAFRETFFPTVLNNQFKVHSLFFPKLSYAAAFDFFMGSGFELDKMRFEEPIFALNLRKSYESSLLKYAYTKNPKFYETVKQHCLGTNIPESEASSTLSDACTVHMVYLAAKGLVRPPPTIKGVVDYVQSLSLDRTLASEPSLETILTGLENYPPQFKSPSENALSRLPALCEKEKSPYTCALRVGYLFLQFGHLDLAKNLFRDTLSKSRDHWGPNSFFLAKLEQMDRVLQDAGRNSASVTE